MKIGIETQRAFRVKGKVSTRKIDSLTEAVDESVNESQITTM